MRALIIDMQGSGVGYYRAQVPYEGMKRAGVAVDYVCLPTKLSDGNNAVTELLSQVCNYDIVHLGYITHLPWLELFIIARERFNLPFITDIDDDILSVPTYNKAFQAYHGGAQELRIAKLNLRVSDSVSVSTDALGESLASDCKEVVTLPNLLYPDDWVGAGDPARHKSGDIRFLFAGNLGRYGDVLEVKSAFEYAMDKYPSMRLFFINCTPDWVTPWFSDSRNPRNNRVFRIPPCDVNVYRYVMRWLAPDVVFAPVQRNKFNKSKSHIKAYDAAMCNAAFLCTDWDTYGSVPASAAIKVAGDYEWREAIDALISDVPMRKRITSELYDWAINECHVDKHVGKWVSLYERVIKRGPVQSLDDIVRPGGQHGVGSGKAIKPVGSSQ